MLHSSSQPSRTTQEEIEILLQNLEQSIKNDVDTKLESTENSRPHIDSGIMMDIFELAYTADMEHIAKAKKQGGNILSILNINGTHFYKVLQRINTILQNTNAQIEVSVDDLQIVSDYFFTYIISHLPNTDNKMYTLSKDDIERYKSEFPIYMMSQFSIFIGTVCNSTKDVSCPRDFMHIMPTVSELVKSNQFIANLATDNIDNLRSLQQWNFILSKVIYTFMYMHRLGFLRDFEVPALLELIELYRVNRHKLYTFMNQHSQQILIEKERDLESQKLFVNLSASSKNDIYLYFWLLISDRAKFVAQLRKKYETTDDDGCFKAAILNGHYEFALLIGTHLNPNFHIEISTAKNYLEFCMDTLIDLLRAPQSSENLTKFRCYRNIAQYLSKLSLHNRYINNDVDTVNSLIDSGVEHPYLAELKSYLANECLRQIKLKYQAVMNSPQPPSLETCFEQAVSKRNIVDVRSILTLYQEVYESNFNKVLMSNLLMNLMVDTFFMPRVNTTDTFTRKKALSSPAMKQFFELMDLLVEHGAVFPVKDAVEINKALLSIRQSFTPGSSTSSLKLGLDNLDNIFKQYGNTNNNNAKANASPASVDIAPKNIPQQSLYQILTNLRETGSLNDAGSLCILLQSINKQCEDNKIHIINDDDHPSLAPFSMSIMNIIATTFARGEFAECNALIGAFTSLVQHMMNSHVILKIPHCNDTIDISAVFTAFSRKEPLDKHSNEQSQRKRMSTISNMLQHFIILDQLNFLESTSLQFILNIIDVNRSHLINDKNLQVLLQTKSSDNSTHHQGLYNDLWLFVCDRDKYALAIQNIYFNPDRDKARPDLNLCLRRAASKGNYGHVVMLCSQYKVNLESTTTLGLNCLELATKEWFSLIQNAKTHQDFLTIAAYHRIVRFLTNMGAKYKNPEAYDKELSVPSESPNKFQRLLFANYIQWHKKFITNDSSHTPKVNKSDANTRMPSANQTTSTTTLAPKPTTNTQALDDKNVQVKVSNPLTNGVTQKNVVGTQSQVKAALVKQNTEQSLKSTSVTDVAKNVTHLQDGKLSKKDRKKLMALDRKQQEDIRKAKLEAFKQLKPENASKLQVAAPNTTKSSELCKANIRRHEAIKRDKTVVDTLNENLTARKNEIGSLIEFVRVSMANLSDEECTNNGITDRNLRVYFKGGYVSYFLSGNKLAYQDIDMNIIIHGKNPVALALLGGLCEQWALYKKAKIINTMMINNNNKYPTYLFTLDYEGYQYDINIVLANDLLLSRKPYANVKCAYVDFDTLQLHDDHHEIAAFEENKLCLKLKEEPLGAIHICNLLIKSKVANITWHIDEADINNFKKELSISFVTTDEILKNEIDFYSKRFNKFAKYIVDPKFKTEFMNLLVHFKIEFQSFLQINDAGFNLFYNLIQHIEFKSEKTTSSHVEVLRNILYIANGKMDPIKAKAFIDRYKIDAKTLKQWTAIQPTLTKYTPAYEVIPVPSIDHTSLARVVGTTAMRSLPTLHSTAQTLFALPAQAPKPANATAQPQKPASRKKK